jgi:biopolymer transport protein ExbD
MAVKTKKGNALGALNLTPLIDVIFQLLIFFLVATRFAAEDREMDVELPTASEAKPLIVQPQEIFVNVDAKGEIFVGGKQISVAQLEEHLEEAARNNPANQSVILRADKRCELDAIVQVINVCNKVGVSHSLTTANE